MGCIAFVLAKEILAFCREWLGPYERIRKIAFAPLPKTIFGKIRRAELRRLDATGSASPGMERLEFEE